MTRNARTLSELAGTMGQITAVSGGVPNSAQSGEVSEFDHTHWGWELGST